MSRSLSNESRGYQGFGLLCSVGVHVALGSFFFTSLGFTTLDEPPVYSVTIEGGKTLGGKMQVAKDDKKSPIAPMENVQEPSPKEKPQDKPVEKPPEKPVEKVVPQPKVAEVPKKEEPKKEEPKKDEKAVTIPEKKAEPQKKTSPDKPQKKEEKKTPPKEDINKEYQKAMQRYFGNSSAAGGQGFGAAKLGGNDMGGGVVKPREFMIYLEMLKERIKAGWSWYDSATVLVSTVEIEIMPDGTIRSQRIVRTSGNPEFDESVLRAVRQANPLPPPPANVYQDFKLVNIVFDPRE